MVSFNLPFAITLALTVVTVAKPAPLVPDASGDKNIGNGAHQQFIGGQCLSSLDCGAGGNNACCAVLPTADGTIGICSGLGAQTQAGKQGCGFGDGGSTETTAATDGTNVTDSSGASANATETSTSSSGTATDSATCAIKSDIPGAQLVGNGQGQQFITGQCFSDADCAQGGSACCATAADGTGVCSGSAVANTAGKQGCGFTCSA
ncbi:hypothetical protein NKR23_g10306 [Pleurostoma richardsiae]|uniref:Biotrophy-associated secreted protein 2 n=1 Tax=Pleurostoma richardsiae TaxID=41990 RepID=A0AA38RKJ9_9PEZI|nr:hypothetical protein NKR23_g10306 [Pleurostoma richardsiae]